MSGSSLAPIILPAVVVPVLAFWLIMVAYADRHPAWRGSGHASARKAPGQLSGEQAFMDTVWPAGVPIGGHAFIPHGVYCFSRKASGCTSRRAENHHAQIQLVAQAMAKAAVDRLSRWLPSEGRGKSVPH